MAVTPNQPGTPAAGTDAKGAAPKVRKGKIRPRVDWKAVWPIPLAVGSIALLASGVFVGVIRMPKDDPEEPLSRIRELMTEDKYLDAVATINRELVPYYNRGIMSPKQEMEFYQLRGRALMYGQEALGVKQAGNYERIIEAFESGRKLGLALEPADIGGLCQAHLFLGDIDKAISLARSLTGVDDERKLRLYREIVKASLKPDRRGKIKDPRLALDLLGDMLEMPNLPLDDRAWVVARQAELRLAGGYADEASVRLLRDFNKFDGLGKEAKAELLFLLGKSYFLSGKAGDAVGFLEAAEADLPGFDDRRGESAVIRAQIQQGWGRNEEARELFEAVAKGFDESPSQPAALLGLAETQAALGDNKSSLEAFREAITTVKRRLADDKPTGGVTLSDIGDRLLARSQERLLQNEPAEAVAFALRAEEAYRAAGAVPATVHLALAVANRANAERILSDAGVREGSNERPDWSSVSAVSATEAKGFLIDAGTNFRQHARLITTTDYDAMMDSLWNAGDAFDRAGDSEAAIEALSTFMQGARPDYPRRSEAIYRQGQVYESRGDYSVAAKLFEQLLAQRDDPRGFAGVWADRSIVPLARCLINMGDEPPVKAPEVPKPAENATAKAETKDEGKDAGAKDEASAKVAEAKPAAPQSKAKNEERAMELLRSVVDGGRMLEPDAREFREALAQLGELHYRRGEFDQAIPRLREAIKRDPDSSRAVMLRYKMADSHRQRALQLEAGGGDEPLSERRARSGERSEHLMEAERMFRQVASEIGRMPAGRASDLELAVRRNATFYAADCVYQQGNYAEAVRHYLAARDQYPQDPSSLMALVQTVSSLIKLERWDEAKAVHERARALLGTLSDRVWNDPSRMLPMERRHWEAWLESRLLLERHASGKPSGTPGSSVQASGAAEGETP